MDCRQAIFQGVLIMTLRAICLALGLAAAAAFTASAAPLLQAKGLSAGSGAEQIRYHRYRYWYPRHPAFWTRDFWGRLRYIGPNSNRTNTHQF